MSEIEALRAEVAELRRMVYELRSAIAQPRYVPPPVYGPCHTPTEPLPNEHFRVWCDAPQNPYSVVQR